MTLEVMCKVGPGRKLVWLRTDARVACTSRLGVIIAW